MNLAVKKKILVAHPYWGRGGAETSTMQFIEAVKDDFEVNLITRGGWNLEELNRVANTSILASEVKIVQIPAKRLLANTAGGAIWHALFLRYCRHIAPKYNIRITASRTIGWGLPAIHFLSDVIWNPELNEQFGEKQQKGNALKRVLKEAGKWIAGKSLYELHPNDIFVANSRWTSSISSPFTTNPPHVIYPAVTSNFKEIPWENRKNEFVSFGRISPEKKIEDTITIIEKIRNLGNDIGLTIFGEFDTSDYSKSIKELVKNKSWIKTPGPIYGEHKTNQLPMFKYGINTCQREAFGISTAEMLKAGLIPFVPTQGAQQEIVNFPGLSFENVPDAVRKIGTIISSEEQQKNILEHLNKQKQKFSATAFKQEILNLLSDFETK